MGSRISQFDVNKTLSVTKLTLYFAWFTSSAGFTYFRYSDYDEGKDYGYGRTGSY